MTNPDYTNCFAWINNNIIAYTLFPKVSKMKSIQKTITENNKKYLRYLQNSNSNTLKIVTTDESTSDPVAKIPKSQTVLEDNDFVIYGASNSDIVIVAVENLDKVLTPATAAKDPNAEEAPYAASSSSSFINAGYCLIYVFMIFIN